MNRVKQLFLTVVGLFTTAVIFAYNPPVGGERLEQLPMPQLLSGGASTAGGALSYAAPEHIVINPAIIAGEQRVAVDFGYSALFRTAGKSGIGSSMQFGLMIPTRWGVGAFNLQGVFSTMDKLDLGNLFILRGAFSRDVTDSLYVGASFTAGFGTDWAVYGGLGFVYRIGTLGFMKDFRWAVALNGLGRTFNGSSLDKAGIDSSKDAEYYPGFLTPRIGVAGTLFSTDKVIGGASVDFSFPTFQNFVSDIGFQLRFGEIVTLHSNWQINAREIYEGHKALIPSIGLTFKFGINTSGKEFFNSKGWQRSDLVVSAAYVPLHDDISTVSGAVTAFMGLRDTNAPEINLWVEETEPEVKSAAEQSVQDKPEVTPADQAQTDGGNQ